MAAHFQCLAKMLASLARLSSPGIRAARGLEAWLAADRSTRELREGAGVFPSSPAINAQRARD